VSPLPIEPFKEAATAQGEAVTNVPDLTPYQAMEAARVFRETGDAMAARMAGLQAKMPGDEEGVRAGAAGKRAEAAQAYQTTAALSGTLAPPVPEGPPGTYGGRFFGANPEIYPATVMDDLEAGRITIDQANEQLEAYGQWYNKTGPGGGLQARAGVMTKFDPVQAKLKAEAEMKTGDAARGQRVLDENQRLQEERKAVETASREKVDKFHRDIEQRSQNVIALADAANREIDPDRMMKEKGALGNIFMAFSLMLGGIGGALTGQGNQAAEMFMTMRDQDIAAQKADIDTAGRRVGAEQHILGTLFDQLRDLPAAEAMAKRGLNDQAIQFLQQMETEAATEEAKIGARQAIEAIQRNNEVLDVTMRDYAGQLEQQKLAVGMGGKAKTGMEEIEGGWDVEYDEGKIGYEVPAYGGFVDNKETAKLLRDSGTYLTTTRRLLQQLKAAADEGRWDEANFTAREIQKSKAAWITFMVHTKALDQGVVREHDQNMARAGIVVPAEINAANAGEALGSIQRDVEDLVDTTAESHAVEPGSTYRDAEGKKRAKIYKSRRGEARREMTGRSLAETGQVFGVPAGTELPKPPSQEPAGPPKPDPDRLYK
jgi:hypothetical protein